MFTKMLLQLGFFPAIQALNNAQIQVPGSHRLSRIRKVPEYQNWVGKEFLGDPSDRSHRKTYFNL